MRAAKVQASLRIRAVSPEPSLLAHPSSEPRGTFRQKARSLAPLNGWACAVKICHDGMLEDTNSLDGAHMLCIRVTMIKATLKIGTERVNRCSHTILLIFISTLFHNVNYCLINGILHKVFAGFIVQHEESWVNYTWFIFIPFILIHFANYNLKNRNVALPRILQCWNFWPAFQRYLMLWRTWWVQDVKMEL